MLRNKTFAPIRKQYNVNYHNIIVLLTCYFYCKYVKPVFKLSNIMMFVNYYNNKQLRKYMNPLIEYGFIIPLAGNSYRISDKIDIIIKEIQESYDKTIYTFCKLHNIDL